jgi:hypothetical protein
MKILRALSVLGLASVLFVACAQPLSASSESETNLDAAPTQCTEGKSCCDMDPSECTEAKMAECEAKCPKSTDADTEN